MKYQITNSLGVRGVDMFQNGHLSSLPVLCVPPSGSIRGRSAPTHPPILWPGHGCTHKPPSLALLSPVSVFSLALSQGGSRKNQNHPGLDGQAYLHGSSACSCCIVCHRPVTAKSHSPPWQGEKAHHKVPSRPICSVPGTRLEPGKQISVMPPG